MVKEKEIWKEYPKYTEYEVSSYGKIRDKNSNAILQPRDDGQGYLRINVPSLGYKRIHNIVMETFVGDPTKEKNM